MDHLTKTIAAALDEFAMHVTDGTCHRDDRPRPARTGRVPTIAAARNHQRSGRGRRFGPKPASDQLPDDVFDAMVPEETNP